MGYDLANGSLITDSLALILVAAAWAFLLRVYLDPKGGKAVGED